MISCVTDQMKWGTNIPGLRCITAVIISVGLEQICLTKDTDFFYGASVFQSKTIELAVMSCKSLSWALIKSRDSFFFLYTTIFCLLGGLAVNHPLCRFCHVPPLCLCWGQLRHSAYETRSESCA